MSFSDSEYAGKRKQTRRERFLPKWIRWCLEWFVGVDRAVLPEGWWWPSTVLGMGELRV